MKAYWTTLMIGLLLVAGVNLFVDPAHRWHRLEIPRDQNWRSDQLWVSPTDLDERAFRSRHLQLVPRPDVLVMGSSRSIEVNSTMFDSRVHLYNASVSGASIEDHLAVWEQLEQMREIPPFVIIFVDPWLFNKNSGQMRWISRVALVDAFLIDQGRMGWLERMERVAGRVRNTAVEVADLFSWSLLYTSVETLATPQSQPPYRIVREAEHAEQMAWRSDGALQRPRKDTVPPALDEARRRAQTYASTPQVYSLGDWVIDSRTVELFELLLQEMKRKHVAVRLVVPPYAQEALRLMRRRPDVARALAEASQVLARISLAQDVPVCDVTDAATAGCTETEFLDGMHALRSCSEKILHHCFETDRTWSALLRPTFGH